MFGAASLVLMSPKLASAGEAQYAITDEFISVCDGSYTSVTEANAKFSQSGWSSASDAIQEALTPDDFLTKVKDTQAYFVELQNGGQWLGAVAQGKLASNKVYYCAITAIDDDPNGYRQDFEVATGLVPARTESIEGERRDIYQATDGNNLYFMREIRTEELSYFTYIMTTPKAK